MVRVKHRWITVQLETVDDVELYSKIPDFSTIKGQKLAAKLLSQRSRTLSGLQNHRIIKVGTPDWQLFDLQTLQNTIEHLFGLHGLGIASAMLSIAYWNPQLGVFTIKTLKVGGWW